MVYTGIYHTKLCTNSSQTLRRNIRQITNAIRIDNPHLEVGQVDDKTLLNLGNAFLHHLVRFLLAKRIQMVAIQYCYGEETSVSMGGILQIDHRGQIIDEEQLGSFVLVIASEE